MCLTNSTSILIAILPETNRSGCNIKRNGRNIGKNGVEAGVCGDV
jgi:hypothetical protein